LRWALSSLAAQTLSRSCFECIVVDNNSSPPLTPERLGAPPGLEVRLVSESRQGISFARRCGITAARADLLVFVDDDNHLDPSYLETALSIAAQQPDLGAFGGIARPVLEVPVPQWKENLLPYLGVRDYGATPITSRETRWGEWEPIGAGMVVRRPVAEKFIEWVSGGAAGRLGRSGGRLMSGDDALIAQCAYRLGFACSYQPALALSHYMNRGRLRARTLAGTILGHGRSYVVLQRLLGNPVPRPGAAESLRELLRRYPHRVKRKGLRTGSIEWCWDLGYFRQARLPD
jgi:glycosyltransferase involved in cell wall biosynthesis